jgi:hypothetical protein
MDDVHRRQRGIALGLDLIIQTNVQHGRMGHMVYSCISFEIHITRFDLVKFTVYILPPNLLTHAD